MNIFVTDPDPVKSAEFLWDNPVRARKMITESMQMMACALKHFGCQESILKANKEKYKTPASIMNHPVTKWVLQKKRHLVWLYWHCSALYAKYKGNGFKNIPQNIKIIENFLGGEILNTKNDIEFFNFAKSAEKGLDFRHLEVHEAYRKYIKIQDKEKK